MKLDQLLDTWHRPLMPFVTSPSMDQLGLSLMQETQRHPVTPEFPNMFRAFAECPYDELKIVIVGQDPYPGTLIPASHVADGIAFSAREQIKTPKSLEFMLKALEEDCFDGFNVKVAGMNDLTHWANQGILMVNTALTTRLGEIGKHIDLWKPFMVFLMNHLNTYNRGLIFVFLGKKAQEYMKLIDETRHFILTTPHPSSANYSGGVWEHGGVFGRLDALTRRLYGPIEWVENVAV